MRRPQGSDEPILYLDYDGVLHHEDVWWHRRRGAYVKPAGFTLFEHAPQQAVYRLLCSPHFCQSRKTLEPSTGFALASFPLNLHYKQP